MTARIDSLTAELRHDSAVVAVPRPRLSWTVESEEPGWLQTWAELRSGGETVRVDGRDSVLVDWPFAPLTPGETREVQVRAVSTSGTQTAWSVPLDVTAGFTDSWVAAPIALPDPERPAQPALLRTTFAIDRPVHRAVLYGSALGAADWSVNGAPADDTVLTPGWTSYRMRLVHEYADVTAHLHEGENVLSARLAGAWWTEQYHVLTAPRRFYGEQPRLTGQLHIWFTDGTERVVATSTGWRAWGDGEIVDSGIYDGEHVDARREPHGWQKTGFDDRAWPAATVVDEQIPAPEPRMAPPVRRLQTISVQRVSRTASGRVLLDFGQNLVGRLRLRVAGPAGAVVTLRHAEVLEGEFDAGAELALRPLRRAQATDSYTLAGDGVEQWEPRFTFHGFRYADIDGWPGEFDPASVEAVVVGSDLRRTGWFDSSHELLNRFHENVWWTLRGNYLAVPQDCPQRDERLGWTGDTQLFAPTASFLADGHAFLRSWLRDLALEQRRLDGLVPLFAPDVLPDFADRGPVAAWGDAIAVIPHVFAQASGDATLLAEFYPAMRAWADLVLAQRDDDGLWSSGRQLGDWLDPAAPPNAPGRGRTDTELVATAYLARTAALVAQVAAAVGETGDSVRFTTAAAEVRTAFRRAFVSSGGRMVCDTQTAYALAIAFDLIEEPELRRRVGDRLADVVRRDGYRITTGIVGNAVLAPALSAAGHHDVAERLVLQTDSPSWLYPVTVGATTIWERWDGLRPDGTLNPGAMISFNHVALGSLAEWLHGVVAGLSAAEPGWRTVRIAPRPLRDLDWAHAEHDCPYGRVAARWERTGGSVRVSAIVPANTTAHVELPDGTVHEVAAGAHEWTYREPAATVRQPVTLDSSMAALADDAEAHRAFFTALESRPNRFIAGAVRANALYTPGRSIRDALIFADEPTLDAVAAALAGAAHA